MTQVTQSTVVGHFASAAQASEAIEALHAAGFDSSQIGVARNTASEADLESDPSYAGAGDRESTADRTQSAGKTPGAWDKVKHFFGSESEGGVVQYADTRVHDGSSHEVTRGDYGTGDLSQSLSGMSVPEERSRYFSHRFGSSAESVVVTVSAVDREEEAERILADHGADLGHEATNYDYSAAPATAAQNDQQRIQLLGEVLRVHKDRISRGDVVIRKEVITENQTMEVPVSHEELVIERVSTVAGGNVEGTIGDSREVRIPLSQEVASLDKSTVVREEFSVGKRNVEDSQRVEGSARHEELAVDENRSATSERAAS